MPNYKHKHFEALVLKILNHALLHDAYDNSLKFCSFTAVKVSNDRSHLQVFVDHYERKKIDSIVEKLNVAKGFFRTALAKSLKTHHVPIVEFVKDPAIDNFLNINKLLDNIKN
jgi:ribosome-binding factor A